MSPSRRAVPRWAVPRWGRAVLGGLLVLAAVAALTVLTASQQPRRDPLDPENALPAGARAVAQVLAARGVEVRIVRGQDELLAVPPGQLDSGTTVLIARTDALSDRTAATAAQHATGATELVLLAPREPVLTALGLPARVVPARTAAAADLAAGCRTALADPQDTVSPLVTAYAPTDGRAAERCYPVPDGAHLVRLDQDGGPRVTLVGSRAFLSNERILDDDNAALALRLLGSTARLVWYVPSVDDIAAGDLSGGRDVVPAVVGPALLVLASAVLGLILWRGRRLGRLVTEPLPVVVRAVETTESRGRMYRRAKDRGRALAVLQQATRTRLTAYLGLPAGTEVTTLAAAAASVSGRPYAAVLALLGDPTVPDDQTLVRLAGELTSLEQAVRHHG